MAILSFYFGVFTSLLCLFALGACARSVVPCISPRSLKTEVSCLGKALFKPPFQEQLASLCLPRHPESNCSEQAEPQDLQESLATAHTSRNQQRFSYFVHLLPSPALAPLSHALRVGGEDERTASPMSVEKGRCPFKAASSPAPSPFLIDKSTPSHMIRLYLKVTKSCFL